MRKFDIEGVVENGTDRRGKAVYEYKGPWFALDQRRLTFVKWTTVAFWLTALGAFALAGFFRNPGVLRGYIVLPYAAALLPEVLGLGQSLKLITCPGSLKKPAHVRLIVWNQRYAVCAAILSAAACACDIGFVLFDSGTWAEEGGFIVLQAIQAAFALAVFIVLRRNQWTETMNTAREDYP